MKAPEDSVIGHHLFRLKYTDLNEIYFTMSLRSFAVSLASIFTPIYLWKLGYSITAIFLYFVVMYLFEAIFEIISALGIKKIGPKLMIATSLPFLALYFFILMTLPVYHWPLWSLAFAGGFAMAIFWEAYHYDFSKAKHREKSTTEISQLYIIVAVLSAVAPFLGGLTVGLFGIKALFFFVIILLFLAMIPLLQSGQSHPVGGKLDFSKIKIRAISKDLISYAGSGWDGSVGSVVWPLFIFFIVKTYQAVGLVTSIALVLTVVVTYIVGKRSDRGRRQKYLKYGAFMDGVIYLLRALSYTVLHVLFFNIAEGFSNSVYSSPYTSEYYLHADEESRSEYIYLMETTIDIGRILLFAILAVASLFLTLKIVLIFGLILGGLGAFLITLMPAAKCEICNPTSGKMIRLNHRPAPRTT